MAELVPPPSRPDARHITMTVTSLKGGQGKSTSTLNLAYPAAQLGLRVLMIDLDSNGGLTAGTGVRDDGPGTTEFLDALVSDPNECVRAPEGWQPDPDVPFEEGGALIPGGYVHLMPASRGLADSVGRQGIAPSKRLRDGLARDDFAVDTYDLVLLDTPGAEGAHTELALRAARNLLLLLHPEAMSLGGFSAALSKAMLLAEDGLDFNIVGTVLNRFRPQVKQHLEVRDEVERYLDEQIGGADWVGLPIKDSAVVGEAAMEGRPLAAMHAWRDTFSNRSKAIPVIAAYTAIAIAAIRDIHGDDRADRIVDALRGSQLGAYPTELLMAGVGVSHSPRSTDIYPTHVRLPITR